MVIRYRMTAPYSRAHFLPAFSDIARLQIRMLKPLKIPDPPRIKADFDEFAIAFTTYACSLFRMIASIPAQVLVSRHHAFTAARGVTVYHYQNRITYNKQHYFSRHSNFTKCLGTLKCFPEI
jgi:hypothetical protein